MTENFLYSKDHIHDILLARAQMYRNETSTLLEFYDSPEHFENFVNSFSWIFDVDKYFLYSRDTSDKMYEFVNKYQSAHKSPQVRDICNELKVELNSRFSQVPFDYRDEYANQFYEQQLVERGIFSNKTLAPVSLTSGFAYRDFWTFAILQHCVEGRFIDLNTSDSMEEATQIPKEKALELLKKIPLVDLQVSGINEDETYDYISDFLFLSSVNFLLVSWPSFFGEHPEYVDAMQILVKKAYKDHCEALKEGSRKKALYQTPEQEFLWETENNYVLISYHTQRMLEEFEWQKFGKKTENPLIQKVKKILKFPNKKTEKK